MAIRSLQEIIDQARPADGTRMACRKCGVSFNSYGGRLWCRFCRDIIACLHPHSIHGYMIKTDGVRNGKRWCITCGKTYDTRKGVGCGTVLFYDLREDGTVPPCERCDSTTGTQLHHWAPRAIFGGREADRWPTAYLCPPCHSLWHQLMRQAAGVRLPPEERIDDYDIPQIHSIETEDVA